MTFKKGAVLVGMISIGMFVAGSASFAGPNLVKACKADLKKFGCKAKTDADAHECLEKNEKQGEKNEGFTHGCYEAHEAYEKSTGKGEKEENEHKE